MLGFLQVFDFTRFDQISGVCGDVLRWFIKFRWCCVFSWGFVNNRGKLLDKVKSVCNELDMVAIITSTHNVSALVEILF